MGALFRPFVKATKLTAGLRNADRSATNSPGDNVINERFARIGPTASSLEFLHLGRRERDLASA